MEERPLKRNRVSIACQSCRDRKIRCDGERPACTACLRGKQRLLLPCVYLPTAMGLQTASKSVQSMADRLQELEEKLVATNSVGVKGVFRQQATPESLDRGHEGSPEGGLQREERNQERVSNSSTVSPVRSFFIGNGGDASNPTTPSFRNDMTFHSSTNAVQEPATDTIGSLSGQENEKPEEDSQYYGDSASTSFIKEMNKTFLSLVGMDFDLSASAKFAHQGLFGVIRADGNHAREVVGLGHDNSRFVVENLVLPSRTLCDHLMERYWTNIYPLFHFVHKPTFKDAYKTLWTSSTDYSWLTSDTNAGLGNTHDAGPQTQVFYCALNVMLALGVHSSDIPTQSRQRAMAVFMKRANSLLIVDMMDRGTVALLQTLLLTAHFYHSYPQKCWNLIGVAGRIAQGLGLHVERNSSKISRLGREMRRRVWHGCVFMDTGVSMGLGRPAMQDFSVPLPEAIDDDYLLGQNSTFQQHSPISSASFFVETMKLNKVLARILGNIYGPEYFGIESSQLPAVASLDSQSVGETEIILRLEAELSKFYQQVPDELRWDRRGDEARASMSNVPYYLELQRNMLHARYLHIQTILYRKMFIKLCQNSKLGTNSLANQKMPEDEELTAQSFLATNCSIICIKTAVKLISLVHKSLRTEAQDTWWYNMLFTHSSGLIITIAQTCSLFNQEMDMESLDHSWELCQETLTDLAIHGDGPQWCLDSIKMMRKRILTEITSRQADALRATSTIQNQSPQENRGALYLDESSTYALPSFDLEDWRDVVAENSLWAVDLGDWWKNAPDSYSG